MCGTELVSVKKVSRTDGLGRLFFWVFGQAEQRDPLPAT